MGHDRWFGPSGVLTNAMRSGHLGSVVLWGPPGCGKTTIARAMAGELSANFVALSAVLDGVKRLREILTSCESGLLPTLLFVDEIHRWNKAQQDALLPHVERGTVTLVGATTENPSFELNAALRSRLQVVRLEPLSVEHIRQVLDRALRHPDGLPDTRVEDEVLEALALASAGDARRALDDLERVVIAAQGGLVTMDLAATALQRRDLRHDRAGEDHYNVLSAFIKSMRGSDPDASIYYLARLLEGGEDPIAIGRRVVVFAAEDVGNADPRVLQVAVAAMQAAQLTGMPEARIPLAQAVLWCAVAPKSNATYTAINDALATVRRTGALPVPPHLRSAPPDGQTYVYPHDQPHGVARQQYLPDALEGTKLYEPSGYAEEKRIRERLAWWRRKLEES